jgi:hypothetical protein
LRIFLATLVLIAAAVVLQGIGSAVRRFAKARRGRWSVSIGIGLATLIFAGGILNLAHIAYRHVVWALVAVAIAIGVNELRGMRQSVGQACPRGVAARIELLLAASIIFAATLFAVATQLPPRQFNYHDDLQKYFAHPVRMLTTGTLAGSPLSALGSETLGGQAFLHGIVLSFAPLPYINGVDAVFALFVLLMIAATAAWGRFGWFPGAALGALLIAVINPLYANVSGLYTGAVLIATAVMLVADEREEPSAVLLGFVYAAMVAIKPTFGLFAAFHWTFSALAKCAQRKHWKAALVWPARALLWSGVCISPWILTFLPTYLSHGTFAAKASPVPGDSAGIRLLSTVDVFDGSNIASYTAIAGAAAFVGILAAIAFLSDLQRQKREAGKPLELFAGAISGGCCFLFLVLYLSRWGGYEFCVRYAVPFLMGSCIISTLMAPSLFEKLPRAICVLLPSVACMALVVLFTPAALARDRRALRYGSILEFVPLATSPQYTPYIQFSLSDVARQQVRKYQNDVPAGEPLFAWINTPYWLDYGRNPIVDIDTAGTATRWAHVPPRMRYFLWQYSGYAVRTHGDYALRSHEPGIGARERMIAARSLALADVVMALANHSRVIASDQQYVLFELSSVRR